MGNRRATSTVAAPKFPRDDWAIGPLERAGLLSPVDGESIRRELPEWVASLAVKHGAEASAG